VLSGVLALPPAAAMLTDMSEDCEWMAVTKLTMTKCFRPTELGNISAICEEESEKGRKAGDRHIEERLLNMINREYGFGWSASAGRLDVLLLLYGLSTC
jgi:hypothetical protein